MRSTNMPAKSKQDYDYWAPADERQLILHYRDTPMIELVKMLDRTPNAIRNKAYRLGLTTECRPWKLSDERRLEEMYKHDSVPVIATALQRSEYAILSRLREIADRRRSG